MNELALINPESPVADQTVVFTPPSEDLKNECYQFASALAENCFCIYHCGQFFYYNSHYHVVDQTNGEQPKIQIAQLAKSAGIPPLYQNVNTIYNQLKVSAKQVEIMPNPSKYILYQNGLLDVETQHLKPPTPQIFNTGCIMANFSPEKSGNHPVFDKFLYEASMGDEVWIKRAWQMIGYILSPDTSAKRIFFLVGASNTGKSILGRLLIHLLSPTLTCSLSLENLCNHHFAASELFYKRLCVSGDEGNKPISSNGIALLKTLSGHDYITSDRKNKSQVTFSPTAKQVICSNHNLHTTIATSDPSFQSRLLVLPFLNPIPVEKQDAYLLDKLWTERDSIVTDAFYHYCQLASNHYQFAGDGCHYENELTFLNGTMPYDELEEFLDTACLFDEMIFTPTEVLYQAFNEHHPGCFKDSTSFSRAVSNLCQNKPVTTARKRTENGNLRGFVGIGIL